jgi:hypothetical protein
MNLTAFRTMKTSAKISLAGLIAAATMAGTGASPASADSGGCAQGGLPYPGTCISVVTGGKNASAHTQWVSNITVTAPREAREANARSLMEAWAGNGPSGVAWYRSGNGLTFTWDINMWIKTDSGICGSYTWSNGSRSIACITIKA